MGFVEAEASVSARDCARAVKAKAFTNVLALVDKAKASSSARAEAFVVVAKALVNVGNLAGASARNQEVRVICRRLYHQFFFVVGYVRGELVYSSLCQVVQRLDHMENRTL